MNVNRCPHKTNLGMFKPCYYLSKRAYSRSGSIASLGGTKAVDSPDLDQVPEHLDPAPFEGEAQR